MNRISHGTCVVFSKMGGGVTNGRYQHGVEGAAGTWTLVFEVVRN